MIMAKTMQFQVSASSELRKKIQICREKIIALKIYLLLQTVVQFTSSHLEMWEGHLHIHALQYNGTDCFFFRFYLLNNFIFGMEKLTFIKFLRKQNL